MIRTLYYAGLVGTLGACLAAGGCNAGRQAASRRHRLARRPARLPSSLESASTRKWSGSSTTPPTSCGMRKKKAWPRRRTLTGKISSSTRHKFAAAGALIRLEGTGPNDRTFVQQPEWQKFANAVSNAGLAALKATDTKSQEALVTANGQLVDACEGCHKRFKPALPSEGITHAHVH